VRKPNAEYSNLKSTCLGLGGGRSKARKAKVARSNRVGCARKEGCRACRDCGGWVLPEGLLGPSENCKTAPPSGAEERSLGTNRVSFAEVTSGLVTKSDKIRALAKSGYSRVEIAALLGIRYQHVRKVLLESGIAPGLKNVKVEIERSPVVVELADEEIEPVNGEFLIRAGFSLLGRWTQPSAGEILLSAKAPNDPGVYAFVLEGVVVYVGLTQTGLKTRMDHYRRGHERQRTSRRVKGLIATALSEKKRVEVLIAIPPPLDWNGLPINTAAGLEMGLIKSIKPVWNILGAT
jgi:hypothetical protein